MAELERRAGRVGPQHDLALRVGDDRAGELLERLVEDRDLIGALCAAALPGRSIPASASRRAMRHAGAEVLTAVLGR